MGTLTRIGLVAILGMAVTPPQTTREFLQHLVGQHLILRHYTGSASKTRTGCDVAVEVKAITFKKLSVQVRVRNIGSPTTMTTGGQMYACSSLDEFSFEINGFDIEQPPEQAEKTIGYVLQTPEAYLAALGIPWHAASSAENESPVDMSRAGVTPAKAVLMVNPNYPEASRIEHTEGKVIIDCVIGTDGRIHDPVIKKGLSKELNKLALDALTFYRSQPAYDGDTPIAVRVPFELSFRLY